MAAERVVGIVPPGTHQWEKLVVPDGLLGILSEGRKMQLYFIVLK